MAGTPGNGPLAIPTAPDGADVAFDAALSCAERIRAYPWEQTPLGPIDRWDPLVRATVQVMLASPVPMALAYGDAYALLYNDAYAEVIGPAHPGALGRPAAEAFAGVWESSSEAGVIEAVYRTGRPHLEAETQVAIPRGASGRVEQ